MKNISSSLSSQKHKRWELFIGTQIPSFLTFEILCILNILELVLDKKSSFDQDWHLYILPFVGILFFTLLKKLLYQRQKKIKHILVFSIDLVFSALVLLYLHASFSHLMAANPSIHTTMAQGIKITCILISMKYILHYWFLIPIMFFFQFIIYASVSVQLNLEVEVSAIISHLSGILILLYLTIFDEKRLKKLVYNWWAEEEKANFWKTALYSGEQGIITFEKNGDIIDMNPNFFSLMKISSKTHANNVKNLKNNFQFSLDDSGRQINSKSLFEKILASWNYITPFTTLQPRVICDDKDQRMYDIKAEFIDVADMKFCLMKVFDMTSNYILSILNNHNFLLEEHGNVEISDGEKSTGVSSTKSSQGKVVKDKFLPKSLAGIRFFKSIIDELIGLNQTQVTPASLVRTVQSSMNTIESPNEINKVRISLDLPSCGWDYQIRTDHKRVQQILLHLLKFSLELSTESKLVVRLSPDSINQNFLVEIMPAEELKNYSRNRQNFDKEYISERLGLAICNALADSICPKEKPMRGVKFESLEEKGFRVYFWILNQSNEENMISLADENLYEENEDENNDISSIGFNNTSANGRVKPSDMIIAMPSPPKKFFFSPKAKKVEKEPVVENKILTVCQCSTLLVIDDKKLSLKDVTQTLRKYVRYVDWGDGSNQGLRMIKERISNPCSFLCTNFKAIFFHFSLGNGGGFEFFRNIRKMALKFNSQQPILIAYDEDGKYSAQAEEVGVDYFFTWPTEDEKIREILQNLHII